METPWPRSYAFHRTASPISSIVEAARANPLRDFKAFLDGELDELAIDRMEGNEEITTRLMSDSRFRSIAHEHMAEALYRRLRGEGGDS